MKIQLDKMPSLRGVRNLPLFQKGLELALPHTGLDPAAPGIIQFVMVTRPRMTALNYLHLRHEGATDVITYDLRPEAQDEFLLEDDEPVIAEIYICPAVALEQSHSFGNSPSRELFLYAVHGLLHLGGQDDIEEEDRAQMRLAEQRVLQEVEKHIDTQHFMSAQ